MQKSKIKYFLKQYIPPLLLKSIRGSKGATYWSGDYKTWAEAQKLTHGYDQETIVNKVYESTSQVIAGRATYERDSMTFHDEKLNPFFFSSFSYASSIINSLQILDFGGAFGSLYWQHRKAVKANQIFKWTVIEQEIFVKRSRVIEEASSSQLNFVTNIDLAVYNPEESFFISSAAVQYIQDPYSFLNGLLKKKIKFLFFDRVAFNQFEEDRISVQTVHEPIYEASYPSWFFHEAKFLEVFKNDYKIVFEYQGTDQANIPSYFKGFFFERKS